MAVKNMILQESNADNVPITYSCEYNSQNQGFPRKSSQVSQLYELVYPCSSDINNEKQYIARKLLENSAVTWKILPTAEACQHAVTFNNVWLFGVSSEPQDETVNDLECQELEPGPGMCCQVIQLKMRFLATGKYDDAVLEDALLRFIRAELSSPELTYGLKDVQTVPVLPENEHPPEMFGETIKAAEPMSDESPRNHLTPVGVFFVVALAGVLFGLLLVWVRRHRRRRLNWFEKHENMDNEDDEFRTVTVVTEGDERVVEVSASRSVETPVYAFDLGENFRNSVMNAVAPTILPVVAALPPEDSSMDDSWAQTDGTVGSLEERLEEITAEI